VGLASAHARAQEHAAWEEAFRVYERGVALFRYPHVKDIWAAYLAQFVARYKGTKLERARDLFRQALDQARRRAPSSAPPAPGRRRVAARVLASAMALQRAATRGPARSVATPFCLPVAVPGAG
jgi:hypothetical protein